MISSMLCNMWGVKTIPSASPQTILMNDSEQIQPNQIQLQTHSQSKLCKAPTTLRFNATMFKMQYLNK